jgi:dephospho-CoA kinase
MFAGKPIIGIVGGIGSGKSLIADLFGQLGCLVIKSDDQVRDAYQQPQVKQTLRQWWGDSVFDELGQVDRKAVAAKVFHAPDELKRLEQLLHPMVGKLRDDLMQARATDPTIQAFVWDVPLLYEVGQDKLCDAVVFVDAPLDVRLARVLQNRGWDQQELLRREKLQMPLDKKRSMAQYIVDNTADAAFAHRQVKAALSRILK